MQCLDYFAVCVESSEVFLSYKWTLNFSISLSIEAWSEAFYYYCASLHWCWFIGG